MTIPVFVFGTLRPGHYNYQIVKHEVVRTTLNAAAKGRMYFAHPGYMGYPIVDFNQDGMVTGDLLYFEVEDPLAWWNEGDSLGWTGGGLAAAFAMEDGAGYTPEYIDTLTPEGEVVKAVAFGWYHPAALRPRGTYIPTGDWNEVKGRFLNMASRDEKFQRAFAMKILRSHPALQKTRS